MNNSRILFLISYVRFESKKIFDWLTKEHLRLIEFPSLSLLSI